jgi:hypothetical protein
MGRNGGAHRPGNAVKFVQQHFRGELSLLVRTLADRGQAHGVSEIVVVDSHD